MADFAVLVTELKIQFKATESKVVAFGGRWVVLFYPCYQLSNSPQYVCY